MKEGLPRKPLKVKKAMLEDDRETLSVLGRAGAKKTNEIKKKKKTREEDYKQAMEEKRLEEMVATALERGDHLLPPEEFEELPPDLRELLRPAREGAIG